MNDMFVCANQYSQASFGFGGSLVALFFYSGKKILNFI